MKHLVIALALASAVACDELHVSPARPLQFVHAPSGDAFAEVRGSWYPFHGRGSTRYAVVLGLASRQANSPPAPSDLARSAVFVYESRSDARVRVRWSDATHLVVSYRPQNDGVELSRAREHRGVRIAYDVEVP